MAEYKCPCCRTPLPPSTSNVLTCQLCGFRFSIDIQPVAPTAKPASIPPPASRKPGGLTIDGYRIVGRISEGGMGEVYKAESLARKQAVAIKILHPELSQNHQLIRRFEREANALMTLRHPGIVDIYDKGKAVTGEYYLAMEFIEGESLRDIIKKGSFSVLDRVQIVLEIADTLAYAHSKNTLHRDVKPENVMVYQVQGRPHVKILDFGLAAAIQRDPGQDNLTRDGMMIGTPFYMSPEQRFDPRQVDARTDVYALGVIFYELLTGELPVGMYKPPSQLAKTAPTELDPIVTRMLEPDPKRRYATMDDASREIRSTLGIVVHSSSGCTPPPAEAGSAAAAPQAPQAAEIPRPPPPVQPPPPAPTEPILATTSGSSESPRVMVRGSAPVGSKVVVTVEGVEVDTYATSAGLFFKEITLKPGLNRIFARTEMKGGVSKNAGPVEIVYNAPAAPQPPAPQAAPEPAKPQASPATVPESPAEPGGGGARPSSNLAHGPTHKVPKYAPSRRRSWSGVFILSLAALAVGALAVQRPVPRPSPSPTARPASPTATPAGPVSPRATPLQQASPPPQPPVIPVPPDGSPSPTATPVDTVASTSDPSPAPEARRAPPAVAHLTLDSRKGDVAVFRNEIDGSYMALIPGCTVECGIDEGAPSLEPLLKVPGEQKDLRQILSTAGRRSVKTEPFLLDQREVSAKQWRQFLKDTTDTPPHEGAGDRSIQERYIKQLEEKYADTWRLYPMVYVTWQDAVDYLHWCRKELPTEDQWEVAARHGHQGLFPWGKNAPPLPPNVCRARQARFKPGALPPVDEVVTGPAGPGGIRQLAGNVAEWCADEYRADQAGNSRPDPAYRVVRGGSWKDRSLAALTVFARDRHVVRDAPGCGHRGLEDESACAQTSYIGIRGAQRLNEAELDYLKRLEEL